MAPVVDGLISEYEDSVAIRKYDVESSDAGIKLANDFGVQYVPTFVFVDSEGNAVDQVIGEVDENTLRKALDDLK